MCDGVLLGALEGLDWNNVVLAGGAALNCLLKVPPEHREARGKWLGPDRTVTTARWEPEADDPERSAHGGDKKTIRAKSGYGSSDVDLLSSMRSAASEWLCLASHQSWCVFVILCMLILSRHRHNHAVSQLRIPNLVNTAWV